MKSNTAIKIVSGVLVVALVVVAALALAGVFNAKNIINPDIAQANSDPSVKDVQMVRGVGVDTVLYVKAIDGSKVSGSVDSILRVRDNKGAYVTMAYATEADAQGNPGFKPAKGWTAGMYYSVNLASGYVFVAEGEQYDGESSVEIIIANRESTEADTKLSDSIVYLQAGKYSVVKYPSADLYTLTVEGNYDNSIANPVFVVDVNSDSYRLAQGSQIVKTESGYTATVELADVDDVYSELYINKSFGLGDGVGFEIDEAATEASIRSCDWFIAAVEYIYGESMADEKGKNEWVKVDIKPSFEAGSPSKVTLKVVITFKGITKDSKGERDKDSQIAIVLNNVFTPVFDVHVQKEEDSKAFDVNLALDIDTTASVTYTFGKDVTSYGKDANETMADIANKVAALVKNVVADKLGNADNSAKPYTFAKWIIPIGTLPICIEDNLGIELQAKFSGQVGVSATNSFHVEVGAVYADGDLKGYGNVDDNFHFEGVTLAGTAGAKFGLVNEVGISAYGVISIDLGLHAGVYARLSGRLELTGDDIIKLFTRAGELNIIPAYYFETGIYIDLTAAGKVFGITLKQFTLLSKEFPLFTAGHKYLPVEGVDNPFVDETIYMESSYYYIQNWDVNALDIENITAASSKQTLAYSEFDYELGDNLRMDGNRLIATKAGEFTSYIKVTSKVNKQLSKTVTIIKNPEMPTATVKERIYDKNDADNVVYNVMLNGSKLISVSIDGVKVAYTYQDGDLTLPVSSVSKLAYGAHNVVVESSKGYLSLVLRVISSASVSVDTSAVVYDKAAAGAVQFAMALQGNAVVSVKENGAVVSSKYYNYRESDGSLVMTAAYWDGKELGQYVEEVLLSNGETYALTVNVVDSRSAKLLTSEYDYVFGSGDDLALAIELYNNTISSIIFDGNTILTDSNVIDAAYFEGKQAGVYTGSVNGLAFSVNITKANNALVIPVQTATYYKSSNEDVTFQVKKMPDSELYIANCAGFVQKEDSVVIKASVLANAGEVWTGEILGADNKVTLTINVVNDLLPSIDGSEFSVSGSDILTIDWNLQGIALNEVYVDGLDADDYTKTLSGLKVAGAGLDYGTINATIYTPVNAISLSIAHSGTPSISASYALNKTSGAEVQYALDPAHLSFDYLTVDGADILPIQYRYSDGVLTLSNDFAYNLAAGNYTVKAVLSDGSILQAGLTIQGDIEAVDAVGAGTSDSPFLIYTADQLANVYAYVNNAENHEYTCYRLMADIDMNGYSVEPIGTEKHPYKGCFDGNGYTISNINITKTVKVGDDGYAIGLFGFVAESGIVENVRLSQATVTFAQSGSVSAGLIAGRNAGTVMGIYVNGSKIVAESKSWLNIKNAYFDLGAVVGYNNGGVIKNVDVTAEISGKVKGLNVLGIQVTGRKSLINVGAVVGYFTTENKESSKLVSNIKVTANLSCSADNKNPINQNGWYGYTDLSELAIANCIKRCKVSVIE